MSDEEIRAFADKYVIGIDWATGTDQTAYVHHGQILNDDIMAKS